MAIMDKTLVCSLVLVIGFQRNFAYPDPFYVWPLAPGQAAAEIASLDQSSAGTTGCLLGTSGHPSLDYAALKLSGSPNSYVEFTLETSEIIQDFSFMLFVLPEGVSGTLFQYEKQDMNSGSGEIKMITLFYNDSTLYLDAKGENSTDTLLTISLVTYIQSNDWTPIIVSYDQGSEEFEIFAGNVSIKQSHVREKPLLGLPGKVKVGGTFNQDGAYLGRMTCLHFYEDKTSDNDFGDALLRCMSNLWPSSLSADNTFPSCESKEGFYKVISRGTPPAAINPIANMTSTTKIKCAQFCSLPTNACVSFAINKLDNTCSLYDVDASSYLIGDKNSLYYVSNALIGCC
ncbi:uncharacterized protein LOC132720510 [Ruditapes philippinarum]|uniref:uncharacterized protein LOC132720510 n=1 Tax=Ruditapes philippinarum TaxID=129788 RepID=UPI00295AFD37|nr:uncharacterized protein LOC132720510 [Ruditapes philippinarum]